METTEQLKAMDGTQGSEEFLMVGNNLMTREQYEAETEYVIKRQYKRWPKWWPKEYKPTHREVWTWKFGYDRSGNATCYRMNSTLEEIK